MEVNRMKLVLLMWSDTVTASGIPTSDHIVITSETARCSKLGGVYPFQIYMIMYNNFSKLHFNSNYIIINQQL